MDAKAKSKKWGVWAPTPLSNNTTIHLCSLVRNVKAKNREKILFDDYFKCHSW